MKAFSFRQIGSNTKRLEFNWQFNRKFESNRKKQTRRSKRRTDKQLLKLEIE